MSMLILLAALAAAPVSKPVTHASPTDCAVIVAVGRGRLNWGAAPPAYDLFPEFDLPGGGVYREDCAWSALGVAVPVIGGPDSVKAVAITRPTYVASRARATVHVTVSVSPRLADGTRPPPFLQTDLCTAERRAGQWRFVGCTTEAIT